LEVKQQIVHGVYAPGTPLSESKLSWALRASRTPVREALTRLLEEGYVERVRGRGFFVSRVTMDLIRDIFEVRRLLEGAAAARAAELADPEAIAQLRRLADFEFVAGDGASLKRAAEANTHFHVALAMASRNAIFVDLVRHCLDQVTRLIALGLDFGRLQDSASQGHHAVVDAIERRDPEGARRAMELHLDRSSQRMTEALMNGEVGAVTV
jgi:DNA-binding GntR family transcriptional regulator